jgi:hypothetical protein
MFFHIHINISSLIMIGPYMYVTTDSNANIKDYSDKYLFHQNLNKNKIKFST